MFLLFVLACNSVSFDVPQSENVQQNVYIRFSERGIQKYGQAYLNQVCQQEVGEEFEDIVFDVAGFSFSLVNMKIMNIGAPDVAVKLFETTNSGMIHFSNSLIHLTFEFVVKKNTYPYFSDSGTGKLELLVKDMYFMTKVLQNKECPGALEFLPSDASCFIEKLVIEFSSGYGYLYNSIMPLINQFLIDVFNQQLSETITNMVLAAGNDYFGRIAPLSSPHGNDLLQIDQRWIGGATIVDRQFFVTSNGAACLYDRNTKHCSQRPLPQAVERCKILLNSDVTYEVSKGSLNSLLSYLWELNSSALIQELGVDSMEIQIERIVNTGIVLIIKYSSQGQENSIQVLGKLKTWRQAWAQQEVDGAVFAVGLDQITNLGAETPGRARQIVSALDPMLEYFAFSAYDAFNMDVEHAKVLYCSADWVLIGIEIKPSEK